MTKEINLSIFPYESDFNNQRGVFQERLRDFADVSKDRYFYELCYCICTPQSRAANAMLVQAELESLDYRNRDVDCAELLSRREHYIRFHNTKARHLASMKAQWLETERLINTQMPSGEVRDILAKRVAGIGMKEAGHFLRNIGHRGLAILDRHILKHLIALEIIDVDSIITPAKNYHFIEKKWLAYCKEVKIDIDEMDLFFWSRETGEVLK